MKMVKRKLYQLLTKGVGHVVLDRLVGENLIIRTVQGNELILRIKEVYFDIKDPPQAEFITEHGNLVLLDTASGLGILFGKPIQVNGDNKDQVDQGDNIYSVTIAGVTLINGYPKELTEKEGDT